MTMLDKLMKASYFDLASASMDQLEKLLGKTVDKGYSSTEVEDIREKYGDNEIDFGTEVPFWKKVVDAYFTPFTLVLFGLAAVTFVTDYVIPPAAEKDLMGALIIIVLVLVSGTVALIQNLRSDQAVEQLESIVEVTAEVKRDGTYEEIRTEEIVVGDVVRLRAGNMIPADMRLIRSKDLFISQASLTGEGYPVEKRAHGVVDKVANDTSYETMLYTGSEVVSGTAEGVVVRVGNHTLFGEIADELSEEPVKTSFDIGVEKTSMLLIQFMAVMAPTVILINGFTKGDWMQALLFGISIAVGLTPQMLPMIVTSNLVKGANDMAKKGTIVRNLNSIQNFGAIDVLVTDKTGTLTQDNIVLQYHLDIDGHDSEKVLNYAYLNSYYQTGLGNLIDKAIISAAQEQLDLDKDDYQKIDEIPFDFERRRLSVVVKDEEGHRKMITKGAIEEMLAVSSAVAFQGEVHPLTDDAKEYVMKQVNDLNSQGLRVLGIAQKDNPRPVDELSVRDESDMVLIGYLAFLDPPKESTANAIKALAAHKIDVKIMTGDNELVTKTIAEQVGLKVDHVISGEEIAQKTDDELVDIVEKFQLFVKLNPTQKSKLVRILRDNDHVVGFMGDGINDAPALRAADVGISVDNAVDIAKESADIILLEKDLMVLEEGIIAGRRIFGNTMKYIKITTSSNFGNVFSVLMASLFLPFLPMLPIQILFLDLIYEFSSMSIPWDHMNKEYLKEPKKWTADSIQDFMFWFGPISSVFDILTYAVMYFFIAPAVVGGSFKTLGPNEQLLFISIFQTGWFIVSLWTQTLVLHALRTRKLPFIESHPSFVMMTITTLGIVVGTIAPYTGLASALNLTPPPAMFWWLLGAVVIGYLVIVQIIKHFYLKRHGELL